MCMGRVKIVASKPEIEHGIDDKDTWWYRCPVCHDPLDYKQEICGWCYEVIEWEKEPKQKN